MSTDWPPASWGQSSRLCPWSLPSAGFPRGPQTAVTVAAHLASRLDVVADVGKFAVSELPAGAYRITIDGGDASTRNLPAAYTSAESAVLALNVKRDMHDVRMYARRNYKPSVD